MNLDLPPSSSIEDIRLAARQMTGQKRRLFLAEMTHKYCQGNARQAESVFGWGRQTIETGLGELRTGLACIGSPASFCGNTRWEEKYPQAAKALIELAESHSQQDPSFQTTIAYTRLTAQQALDSLQQQGFRPFPSLSSMKEILNRLGFRLRKVLKARPQKN